MKQNGCMYNPVVGCLGMNDIWIDEFDNELEDNGSNAIMVKSIENVHRIVDKVKAVNS